MTTAPLPASAPIAQHLVDSAKVKQTTIEVCAAGLNAAIDVFAAAFAAGRMLLLFGKGGSAADCHHFAAQFTSVLRCDYAIALATEASFLRAHGNGCGFDTMFAWLVNTNGVAGDVLIGINTSGQSRNFAEAVRSAKSRGLRTIVLTGAVAGTLSAIAVVANCVPNIMVRHIQETHAAIGQAVCKALEERLFSRPNAS